MTIEKTRGGFVEVLVFLHGKEGFISGCDYGANENRSIAQD